MDDRPRKDRLIQTRVPQDLESTLKDEARKRRLSVSHLIRNVLEDTFSLVDNVVSEVDRVVHDSVEVAQAIKRDAQRLAATARGETAHRTTRGSDAPERAASEPSSPSKSSEPAQVSVVETSDVERPLPALGSGALTDVYGFQELVLNREARCASCSALIPRGTRAFLGMSDDPSAPRVWVCQECVDTISR